MDGCISNKSSPKKKILKNKLISAGSLPSFNLNNINAIFPAKMLLQMKKFINRFSEICPGFNGNDNLLYAPAIEWNTYQIKVNSEMKTNQKNLYIIGDRSGLTQGIVAAGITGIITARSIIGKAKRGIMPL